MCTIEPSNHFGPIPGVPVGSLWIVHSSGRYDEGAGV